MADAMRTCAKTACRWPAAATLSYRYATRQVWLQDLGEDHPATHDLCPHHAAALTVPRGWTLVDHRSPQEAVREPSAAEVVAAARLQRTPEAAPPVVVPASSLAARRSRYDALLDELADLAPDHALVPAPGRHDAVPPLPGEDHPERLPGQLSILEDADGVVVPLDRRRGPPARPGGGSRVD